jgi:ABC-2 type transport system permease protein
MTTFTGATDDSILMSSSLTAISALVRRDLLITASYRLSFGLEAVYGVLGLLLYYFISRTFSDISSSNLGDAPSYFAFAAVGIVVGTILDASTTSVGYRMREEQTSGTLEALSATPVGSIELSIGLVGFPFLFASLQATVYLSVASVLLGLDVSNASWAGLVIMLLVSGVALAPIGVLAGAAILILKRGQMIAGATVYLMSILGGMLFPVAVLPDWLEPLATLVPLRYALDGSRDALFAGSGWEGDAAVLGVWALFLWPAALFVFDRAGAFARRAGSLAEY